MRKIVVAGVSVLIVTLSIPGLGLAQGWFQIQGTIQVVDCQTNALVLEARDGTHAFPLAPNATVTVNSVPLGGFCALRQYVGSTATVTYAAGTPMLATSVAVFPAAAPAGPPPAVVGPPAPAPVPGYGPYGPPYPPYAAPYCYGPYAWPPYYSWPYCYGPYSGYVPYYGPAFGIGIGIAFEVGPRFRHGRERDRRFVGIPRFHDGDRDRRFVGAPRFHGGGRERRFIGGPGIHGRGGPRH